METTIGPTWEEAIAKAHSNAFVERSISSWIDPGLSFVISAARLLISFDLLTACKTPG